MQVMVVVFLLFLSVFVHGEISREWVETYESKISFANNLFHKIEFDSSTGHQVHYFTYSNPSEVFYVCSKTCVVDHPSDFLKHKDKPTTHTLKRRRPLEIFRKLTKACQKSASRPTIKNCSFNHNAVPGMKKLVDSF